MGRRGGLLQRNATNIKLIYWLYLALLATPITTTMGYAIARMNRGNGTDWLDSHYTFQIRTLWIGLLYLFIGVVLTYISAIPGTLIVVALILWLIIRCVRGLRLAGAQQRVPDPTSWIW